MHQFAASLVLLATIAPWAAHAQNTRMSMSSVNSVAAATILPTKQLNLNSQIDNPVEAALARALDAWAQGGLKQAISELDATLEKTPNFRLGHLLRGDLLMAQDLAGLNLRGT